MNIVIVCSQLSPFSAHSAEGRLAGQLAVELTRAGHDVCAVSAVHGALDPSRHTLARRLRKLAVDVGSETVEVGLFEGALRGSSGRAYFLDHAPTFRDGTPHRAAYVLARAALQLAREGAFGDDGGGPDVVHALGTDAGLVPLLARHADLDDDTRVVFSFNDPAALGLFDAEVLDELGFGRDEFHPEGLEFHGQVSLLKAGIVYADEVTTPSPAFARELTREEHGFGLDGLYRARGAKLTGVPAGADAGHDPAGDHRLPARYSAEDLGGKARCKRALQSELGLRPNDRVPLLAMIGPFGDDSGLELMLESASIWTSLKLQVAFVGEGDRLLLGRVADLCAEHEHVVHHVVDDARTTADLTRRCLAGADALLLPLRRDHGSGLVQKALRYGAVPLIRRIGGLRDAVVDFDVVSRTGTGFAFDNYDATALGRCIERVVRAYDDNGRWKQLVLNTMAQDVSWEMTARRFEHVYSR